MSTYRIIGVDRSNAAVEFRLNAAEVNPVGRSMLVSADVTVSSRHAELCWRNGTWWIADAGSSNGTYVRGTDIRTATGPHRLDLLEPFRLGVGHYAIVSDGWRRVFFDDLVVEFDALPAYNAAVAAVTTRIVRRLAVRNWGRERSGPLALELALNAVGKTKRIDVTALGAGESALLAPLFEIDGAGFSRRSTSAASRAESLTIRLHDGSQTADRAVERSADRVVDRVVDVHPPDQWIRLRGYAYESALAALAFPHDRDVTDFVKKALGAAPDLHDPVAALRRIYSHLLTHGDVTYRKEPPLSSTVAQVVRPPLEVLTGGGTCLDLALFVAACLECLQHQPVVAVLSARSHWHVIVGCWRETYRRREPVLSARRGDWLAEVEFVDPNGFSLDPRYRRDFDASRDEARAQLDGFELLFAVDVAAARLSGIAPLSFEDEPEWSERAISARDFAETLRRTRGVQRSASSLLCGLLSVADGSTEQVFRKLGLDPQDALETARSRLVQIGNVNNEGTDAPAATRSYEEAIRMATSIAAVDASPVVTDDHLLRALLRTTSVDLRRALSEIGTSVSELLSQVEPKDESRSTIRLSSRVVRARRLALDESGGGAGGTDSDALVAMLRGILSLSDLPASGPGQPSTEASAPAHGTAHGAAHRAVHRAALEAALDDVVMRATQFATGEQASVVEERHLIRAILSHDSDEIDSLLSRAGMSREALLKSSGNGSEVVE